MHTIRPYLDRLAELAHPDGGWGYAPGQAAHLEPTCLALLALSLEPGQYAAEISAGKAWLETCALADGTFRLERGRPEAVWPTALVLLVQTVLSEDRKRVEQTAAALL